MEGNFLNEFEHQAALCVYANPNRKSHDVTLEQIQNPAFRVRLQDDLDADKCALFTRDGEHRLFIRESSKRTPHFYCHDGAAKRDLSRSEQSNEHKALVDDLLGRLNNLKEDFSIGYYDKWEKEGEKAKPTSFHPILKLNRYMWGKEVVHSLSNDAYCRFDIAGKAREKIGATQGNTLAAIEVIHTSLPSRETLEVQLNYTRTQPCLVMYSVIPPPSSDKESPSYFLKVNVQKKIIRSIFYLYRGYAWKGGVKIPFCTAAKLEAEIKNMVKDGPERPFQHAARGRSFGMPPPGD